MLICLGYKPTHIAKFMGPIWGPPGSYRPQMGPTLTPWTLLSGNWFVINETKITTKPHLGRRNPQCRSSFVRWRRNSGGTPVPPGLVPRWHQGHCRIPRRGRHPREWGQPPGYLSNGRTRCWMETNERHCISRKDDIYPSSKWDCLDFGEKHQFFPNSEL